MPNKSLKILHLFNSYLPQTENWAYHLIENTPEVEIHVGANHYLKNNFYHPDFSFIDNYYDELRKLNRHLNKKDPIEFLKKLIIKSIPLFFGRTEQLFINYAINNKIDLIHAHFADVGWQFLKVAQKTGLPLVISFYGWDYEKLPFINPEYKKRFKILFKKADAFICEGEHGTRILQKMGCAKEKIHIVQLGVETSKIPIFKRIKNKNNLKLIQIASFAEKKGHIFTLKAFVKALKLCPNMKLTLVGNTREPAVKNRIENYIINQSLSEKVEVVNFVDYDKIHNFLKDFQVFIHPSCYSDDKDCEGGAPIILLDAQATGMPVISTSHCDIPSEVIHMHTGFLSPEKDINALAKHIKICYEMDQETYETYCNRSRKHVEKNFCIKENSFILAQIYESVCNM